VAWPPNVPPKAELRAALLARHPWLASDELGPRNVVAGDCDRCHAEPRLVQTCGPDGGEYGRRCATAGDWCDGHAAEAAAALRWLAGLPEDADDVAYLWWLATGEVRYKGGSCGSWPSRAASGAVHRKAEEERAVETARDDDNAARRRAGRRAAGR
jgi:hypothetical protein